MMTNKMNSVIYTGVTSDLKKESMNTNLNCLKDLQKV